MFLVESMKESHSSRADLTIYPEIAGYGLLDFAKYEEIAAVGYAAALPRLREWLGGDSEVAQQAREVIESAKQEIKPKRSMNEVEYGTRRNYMHWRRLRMDAVRLAGRFLKKSPKGSKANSSGSCSSPDGGDRQDPQLKVKRGD